jgi:tetratricopeptide (TPR) repeat protein
MAGPLTIAVEPVKALSAIDEANLLQEALRKNPASATLRDKLGRLFNELDQFDDTVALLSPSLGTLDSEAALVLAQACFALREAHHLELARLAAERAKAAALDNFGVARAMAEQAKVQLRMEESADAITILRAALALDVNCKAAFKRLAVQLLRQGDFYAVEQLTSDVIAAGICHSRVLAARTTALAAIGHYDEAKAMVGNDRYLHRTLIAPPTDGQNLAQLNSALADELIASKSMRHDRFGTASLNTKRLDSPTAADNPLWYGLLEHVARLVEDWVNVLPCDDHPWLAARPEKAFLRSWCVITEADGHERWHMHPDGWLSGGYYPIVPSGTGNDHEKAGNIAFGLPDGLPGADAAARFGELSVQPEPGQLMLFPSHAYHRTYPHGQSASRICVAFDIIPA